MSDNLTDPPSRYSMSMSDREVLENIMITLNELRAFMSRTTDSIAVLKILNVENNVEAVTTLLDRMDQNTQIIHNALIEIREHLIERLNIP